MTAVITKQNAKDGAFIGGNTSSNRNSEFDTINVKGDATIDGKIVNDQIVNIETRIKTLEDTPADGLPFEDGLNDFIIDINTLKIIETDECNIIEIGLNEVTDYEGDVFELTFPSNMNLTKAIISVSNGKFSNSHISWNKAPESLIPSTILIP